MTGTRDGDRTIGTTAARLAGAWVVATLTTAGLVGCGEDTGDTNTSETSATSGGAMTDGEQAGYTVFPATGSVPVGSRFEVSLEYIENGQGHFWVEDGETGEGRYVDIGLGESAEFGGWTFEVTQLSDQSAGFVAVDPAGVTYPQARQ